MMLSRFVNPDVVWFEHLSRVRVPSLRLFCFPYAGGSTEIYRAWQRWFPEQIDVCLAHLPGRGKRFKEPAFTRLSPMVKAIADHMDSKINVPYALFGHSMGALISFELGRELFCRHGTKPRRMFVSGCRAPQWPRNKPATFNLPHDEFIAELQRLSGTPREVLDNPELVDLILGPLRADFETVETYEYRAGGPLTCAITVYGGLQDEHVPLESCMAWQEQTSEGCQVRMFNGDHFFIRNPEPDFVNSFRQDVLSSVP